MQFYRCPSCTGRVYFENLACLQCGIALGYAAHDNTMVEVDAASAGYQLCANRVALGCNWITKTTQAGAASLCDCCRYTRTLPPLDDAGNLQALRTLEQAKRYLFYSLLALRLPIPDRTEQPETGLAFDFLTQLPNEPRVVTGHKHGVITINIAEADDAKREQRRVSLHEPYRTVLGHLRHEIGHFYWDQLLAQNDVLGDLLDEFRRLFGDERQDYAAALKTHYSSDDKGSWIGQHISYYASAHPWEDWAETWAHYLHITDALDTAAAWGVKLTSERVQPTLQSPIVDIDEAEFSDRLIKEWLPLSQYLNSACRSLGEADAYPFILPPPVVDKLVFVHRLLRASHARLSLPTLNGQS